MTFFGSLPRNLESVKAPTLRDARVQWAALVTTIVRRGQARKLISPRMSRGLPIVAIMAVTAAVACCSDQEAEQRKAAAEKIRAETAIFSRPESAAIEIDKRLRADVLLRSGVLIASDEIGAYGMRPDTAWLVLCGFEGLNELLPVWWTPS